MNHRNFAFVALLSCVSAAGCTAEATGPGDPPEDTATTDQALSEQSGLHAKVGQCLDVQWGNSKDGTPVWMWPCTGSVAQGFRYEPDHTVRIAALGDKCLTADTRDGGAAYLSTCVAGAAGQKWYLHQDGSIRLGDENAGLCLDVRYAGTAAGTAAGISYCNGNPLGAQVWNFSSWSDMLTATTKDGSLNHAVAGRLESGLEIRSKSGQYRAKMQGDCNLVVYDGANPTWQSKSYGAGSSCYLRMQDDGNLVVYSGAGRAVWQSGTWGLPGGTLVMQNDGNLVIYQNNRPVWASQSGRLVDPPSTQTVSVLLNPQPVYSGYVPYTATFPGVPCDGCTVSRIENSAANGGAALAFFAAPNTSADCGDASKINVVYSGQPANLPFLYHTSTPATPLGISACVAPVGGSLPSAVWVNVTYTKP